MPRKRSDVELIHEWRKGEVECFEELSERYGAKIYGLALRLMRNTQDAEEVLQDVFVTLYRKIDTFEGKSSFSSWLYRITFNAALMRLRKRREPQSLTLEDALPQINSSIAQGLVEQVDTEKSAWRGQLMVALENAVQKLPDEYRLVFVLKDVDGLTSREVAEILKISVPAVKSRLHRSRLMMRRRLKKIYHEYFLDQETNQVANG